MANLLIGIWSIGVGVFGILGLSAFLALEDYKKETFRLFFVFISAAVWPLWLAHLILTGIPNTVKNI